MIYITTDSFENFSSFFELRQFFWKTGKHSNISKTVRVISASLDRRVSILCPKLWFPEWTPKWYPYLEIIKQSSAVLVIKRGFFYITNAIVEVVANVKLWPVSTKYLMTDIWYLMKNQIFTCTFNLRTASRKQLSDIYSQAWFKTGSRWTGIRYLLPLTIENFHKVSSLQRDSLAYLLKL